jgi:hypothetical protein
MRKLSTLILLGLLAVSCMAQDLEAAHKCTHDEQEHIEPEIIDIAEDFNPEGNDHSGRTLASYNNMRTYGYYGLLNSASSTNRAYFGGKLMGPILDYFSKTLKVKYPVSGLWKTSSSSTCGVSTPSVLRTGVSADFVMFVKLDSSSSYVANTISCSLASGTNRPLAGRVTISTAFMKATSDVLLHEKNMMCIMHEVTHALGFASNMYPRFLNANGNKLSGHITSASLDGATSKVLNVAPLTSRLRDHFGCSTLKGAYMENSGSSATAGSHFERRIFAHEMMTSGLIYQQVLSQFTLALFEGSGWYVPDYSMADGYWWGKGEGCSFITGACSASKYDEFCSSSARACTNGGRGGGSCQTDGRSDNCRFIHPNVGYDCDNSNADNYARIPNIQAFGRGKNSKCFTGTLASSSNAGSQTTFCFQHTCSGSGSSTELTLKLGSKTVVCTAKGNKSVSGYAGVIHCPDPLDFCSTVGAKKCPRGCMGRGTCVNGVCQCNIGKGVDCAF